MAASTANDIWVAVVEDNWLAGKYIVALLSQDAAIHIVPAQDAGSRLAEAPQSLVFVVDCYNLPIPLNECMRRFKLQVPGARFVILDRERSPESLYRLVWFGINGFIEHERVEEELLPAIRHIAAGGDWIPANVLAMHSHALDVVHDIVSERARLTRREADIIELVKRRLSNKEIGEILKIKETTVKFHLTNIFSKLHASSRRDFVDEPARTARWLRPRTDPEVSRP